VPTGPFHIFEIQGTKSRFPREVLGLGQSWKEITVAGRSYFTRQAKTLLEFAKSTSNRELAAFLVEKAAALKTQVDESSPPPDLSPRAPDVSPEM
jgi:hypothetical protein